MARFVEKLTIVTLTVILSDCGLTTLIAGPPFEVGGPDASALAEMSDPDAPLAPDGPPTDPAPVEAAPTSAEASVSDTSIDASADPDTSAPIDAAPTDTGPYIPPGDIPCVQTAPCGPFTVTAPVQYCAVLADGGFEVRPSPPANSMCSDYSCADWTVPCGGTCTDGTLGWPVVKITCR